MSTSTRPDEGIDYPESDGQPIADNTLQFRWIQTIAGGLDALFRDAPDVFVAGDLLWYPVKGNNLLRNAPDALVAFGRPKGERGSYKQWEEGGIAPQVVFEVLSPGNRAGEMKQKLQFYQRYGVEEYYVYDPDRVRMRGYLRDGGTLRPIPDVDGWTSPRLGITFDLSTADELRILDPDGRPFQTYAGLAERAEGAERHAAEERRQRTEAERRAAEERREREAAEQKAERLRAQLRALGIEPEG